MFARALIAAAVIVASAALAGCGFRPLYGQNSAGSAAELADIYIESIPNRAGQKLRNMLLARLNPNGPPEKPDWRLLVRLNESISEVALRRDETATRANLTVTASFILSSDEGTASGLMRRFSGAASSTNSYNRLQSDYATLSAQEDARDRALRTLAEEIRLRIAAALENPAAMMTVSAPAAARPAAPRSEPRPAPITPTGPVSPLLPGQ